MIPDRYLEIERAAETQRYLAGSMYAMSGSSLPALLVANAGTSLASQLTGRDCFALIADIRLYVQQHNLIAYPDVFVVCGDPKIHDRHKDTLLDATVIVQVSPPSTKNYDRGEKFRFYRALPSFREYLPIAQHKVRAEHHVRQSDGSCLMREYISRSDEIEMKAIGCNLRLQSVYDRVRFETTETRSLPI